MARLPEEEATVRRVEEGTVRRKGAEVGTGDRRRVEEATGARRVVEAMEARRVVEAMEARQVVEATGVRLKEVGTVARRPVAFRPVRPVGTAARPVAFRPVRPAASAPSPPKKRARAPRSSR